MIRTVKRIIDGDTVELNRSVNGSRFARLANVNAPERHQFGGRRATNTLKGLIGGKQITVIPVAKDVYGRTVVNIREHRKSINKRMRDEGY